MHRVQEVLHKFSALDLDSLVKSANCFYYRLQKHFPIRAVIIKKESYKIVRLQLSDVCYRINSLQTTHYAIMRFKCVDNVHGVSEEFEDAMFAEPFAK
jgi:hypothetical protein